jgi:hypothetical protein
MEAETLEKKIAKLPEKLKLKVEGYVDALFDVTNNAASSPTKASTNGGDDTLKDVYSISEDFKGVTEEKPKLKREFGGLKGFVKYMADDFDAPLEDFKDYM